MRRETNKIKKKKNILKSIKIGGVNKNKKVIIIKKKLENINKAMDV